MAKSISLLNKTIKENYKTIILNVRRWFYNSPLLVVNTGQISMYDCIVWAEIQSTQISSYSSVINRKTVCVIKIHGTGKENISFGNSRFPNGRRIIILLIRIEWNKGFTVISVFNCIKRLLVGLEWLTTIRDTTPEVASNEMHTCHTHHCI